MPAITDLACTRDTYAFEKRGCRVLEVTADDDGKTTCVVLDATIAYPQGGGQPCDFGRITGERGWRLDYDSVTIRRDDGAVEHRGTASGDVRVGDGCDVTVDEERRRLHARIHSAGHALDVAMLRLGIDGKTLEPTKGQHGATEAYVEYKGKLDETHAYGDKEKLMRALESEMANIIAEGGMSEAAELAYEDAVKACDGAMPSFITPDMKPRIVTIIPNTPGCPCGGTHVKSVSEIVDFKCTGVRVKKGVTRVSYSIPGMESWQ